MGKGVYEPVDEYIPTAKATYPDLVRYLGTLMVELNYDLRAFQHVLLLTRTFQFGTNPNPSSIEGGDDFHGRKIERLSSEQIWDSLITLAAGDPDKQPAAHAGLTASIVGGKPVLVGKKDMLQLSKEVLALKSENEVRSYFSKFLKEVKTTGTGSEGGASMMAMSAVRSYNKDAKVRASELPSPAPRDHFLYLFGASDREVVDAFSREPNVGQVLLADERFRPARVREPTRRPPLQIARRCLHRQGEDPPPLHRHPQPSAVRRGNVMDARRGQNAGSSRLPQHRLRARDVLRVPLPSVKMANRE